MLKNYSDHTISFKIGNMYVEIPAGWTCDYFDDDPELEEFLKNRYPELREPENEQSTVFPETNNLQENTSKKGRNKKS